MARTTPLFRLLETGPAPAAWNMALDAVLLEGCGRDAPEPSPPTVRMMRFSPTAVLVGAYQSPAAEVRLEYCRDQGIDVSRRVTGGGAIFFDESQVGWEVVCRFDDLGWPARPSESLFTNLSQPVVSALRQLGLDAAYRPRNDIEVEGRKISGTGGTDLRGALLFQGTLLVDFDVETMVRALRVPVEKLRPRELESMRERVTWLSRELERQPSYEEISEILARSYEEELKVTLEPGGLTEWEAATLEEKLSYYESDDWVYGRGRPGGELGKSIYPTDGGVVRAIVRRGADPRRLQSAMIDGDFFVFPRRALYDLEAWLKGASARQIPDLVTSFFQQRQVEIPGVGPEGIIAALLEALERASAGPLGLEPRQLNSMFPVCGNLTEMERLRPTHLLLPYCSKPPDCDLRYVDGCDECGRCTIGEAYGRGKEAGLDVRTITSFEHLMSTLRDLRSNGTTAYVGSCCEAFYLKHRRELEEIGVPGLLFDVEGSETCYDLGKSSYAYAGEYEGETSVDVALLESVLLRTQQP